MERIDRLESEARRVLELASVIGRELADQLAWQAGRGTWRWIRSQVWYAAIGS